MASQTVFIGTYTEKLPFVDGKARGIYSYRLDLETGGLTYLSHSEGPRNPSYLAFHAQKNCLYAVQETGVDDDPTVHAFAVEGHTLRRLNHQPAHGGYPCHIAVDQTGQCVLTANYETGSVALYPIASTGALGEPSAIAQHAGSSIHPERQTGPHAHAVVVSPDNRFVLVPDLGMDKVMIYRLDPEHGTLSPSDPPFVRTHTGAGPRHLVFHPGNRFAFCLGELDATLSVYAYQDGHLNPLQTHSTLPAITDASPSCAEIGITPDGRFVYASNRGLNSIARFAFANGSLSLLGHTDTRGQTPRDFAIDPTGAFLIVGNQDTDTVLTFRIDGHSGDLHPTGHVASVPNPVCILPVGT
jgi:6-phosphogluconolactonase